MATRCFWFFADCLFGSLLCLRRVDAMRFVSLGGGCLVFFFSLSLHTRMRALAWWPLWGRYGAAVCVPSTHTHKRHAPVAAQGQMCLSVHGTMAMAMTTKKTAYLVWHMAVAVSHVSPGAQSPSARHAPGMSRHWPLAQYWPRAQVVPLQQLATGTHREAAVLPVPVCTQSVQRGQSCADVQAKVGV